MKNKFIAGSFELVVDGNEDQLLYKGEEFLKDCQSILQLLLDLGLGDTSTIDRFNLEDDEVEWLESMLFEQIYNNNCCLRNK